MSCGEYLSIARNITKEVVLDAESAETDKSNLYLLLGERDQEVRRLSVDITLS